MKRAAASAPPAPPSVCWVAAADYARVWDGQEPARPAPAPAYAGPDRRTTAERRQVSPDRRSPGVMGRRHRLADRRRRR